MLISFFIIPLNCKLQVDFTFVFVHQCILSTYHSIWHSNWIKHSYMNKWMLYPHYFSFFFVLSTFHKMCYCEFKINSVSKISLLNESKHFLVRLCVGGQNFYWLYSYCIKFLSFLTFEGYAFILQIIIYIINKEDAGDNECSSPELAWTRSLSSNWCTFY